MSLPEHVLEPQLRDAIVAHMNSDHADAVLNYARVFAACVHAQQATLTDIDLRCMLLRVESPAGIEAVEIALDPAPEAAGQVRAALVIMAKRARHAQRR